MSRIGSSHHIQSAPAHVSVAAQSKQLLVASMVSFIASNFRTRKEYEASLLLSEPERVAAEADAEEAVRRSNIEATFVGEVVELSGLKSRADLNGKHGRVVKFDASTGRLGVSLRAVTKFGAIERTVVALLPTNLTVVPPTPEESEAAEDEGEGVYTPDPKDPTLREVTWHNLLKSLGLRHLRSIHWSKFEEEICMCLMAFPPRHPDKPGADKCLEKKAGVTSPADREKIIDALLAPAWKNGFSKHPDAAGESSAAAPGMTEEEQAELQAEVEAMAGVMGPEMAAMEEEKEEAAKAKTKPPKPIKWDPTKPAGKADGPADGPTKAADIPAVGAAAMVADGAKDGAKAACGFKVPGGAKAKESEATGEAAKVAAEGVTEKKESEGAAEGAADDSRRQATGGCCNSSDGGWSSEGEASAAEEAAKVKPKPPKPIKWDPTEPAGKPAIGSAGAAADAADAEKEAEDRRKRLEMDAVITSTVLKFFSAKMNREEAKNDKKFDKVRKERAEKSKGVPTADSTFTLTTGRVCEQRKGTIDATDVARPPPNVKERTYGDKTSPVIYPTSEQVDCLAGLSRAYSIRTMACIGSNERILEGMLERRGVGVLALDSDIFKEGDEYYERRIYCSEVRRIGIGQLMRFEAPHTVCLVFVHTVLGPWEAYLARYPTIPLVVVIGNDDDAKLYKPKPKDLEGIAGLKLLRKFEIDCMRGHPRQTCVVYERAVTPGVVAPAS